MLWFHLDHCREQEELILQGHGQRYHFRHAGVAVSTQPEGPFRFVHALRPDGLESLGKAYAYAQPLDKLMHPNTTLAALARQTCSCSRSRSRRMWRT